jgi:hypothetical protein
VLYNLPSTAVDSFFDVFATVSSPGTVGVSGYSLIATSSGAGLTFNPPAINEAVPLPPNNLDPALNHSFPVNTGVDVVYGIVNVPNQPAANMSLGVSALYSTAGSNTTLANNDGLLSVPIRAGAGVTGTFNVTFDLDNTYTGFFNAARANLTNAANFPHVSGVVEVRQSRRGDLNGDGFVNGLDINNFVASLINVNNFQASAPWLHALYIADFGGTGGVSTPDGFVNGLDINGFVAALIAGSPSAPVAVPEPATISLLISAVACGGVMALVRRRRRAA